MYLFLARLVEFKCREDMERAIDELDDSKLQLTIYELNSGTKACCILTQNQLSCKNYLNQVRTRPNQTDVSEEAHAEALSTNL